MPVRKVTRESQAGVKPPSPKGNFAGTGRIAGDYDFLFKSNPNPMWVYDAETLLFLAVNDAAVNRYGYSEDEFLRMTIFEIRPPEHIRRLKEDIRKTKGAALQERGIWTHRSRDGKVFKVRITTHGVLYEGRDAKLVLAQDLTEQKEVEDRFTRFWEMSLDLFCIIGGDGTFRAVNPAFERMTGMPKSQIVKSNFLSLTHRADYERTKACVEKCATARHGMSFQNRFKCGDGSYRWVAWNSNPIPEEGVIYAIGRDITEQEEAHELRSRLAAIVESASDAIIAKNIDGTITAWNRGAQALFGYSAGEAIGKNIRMLIPPERVEEEDSIILRLRQGETIRDFETVRIRKEGSLVDVSLTISPVLDERGNIVGASKIARDITERRRVAEEIKLLNEKLEERVRERTRQLEGLNKELEAFSYSVSHDLRAPLRHISGFTDLLMNHIHQSLDEKGKRYMGFISESVKEMGVLIDDLLSFSRMGRTEMSQTAVSLQATASAAIKMMSQELEGRAVEWRTGNLPSVQADPSMLQLVFRNLIGNAVKYTRPREKAVIEIGSRMLKDKIVVYVKDNGVGFDMKYADRLFGVFQRLHRSDEFEGTGIGLANVRRIIERHGGETWAEGEVGKGATFFFSLPASEKN